ncbi:hypothetical protein CDL12_08878 [Handroanthus impetiginosus]|uniref:Pentacotripeptide-repeat region of PRORP domain-containing protein n=1 Tax=Handroanthus impetiginosus TaxID=429701 RepID=A0A2G9HLR0_9LAMI|nr:hypothetical protein CDL12_08878 [Handroanthus impetiginosus]
MIITRFKTITLKLQLRALTKFRRHDQLSYRYIQSNHIHGASRNKPTKKPRPHKPTRNQLRTPFPFLNHLKQCQNPDEFLSVFNDFYEMGYRHDYPSYASLIYKLARAGKFEDIDAVLDFLRTRSYVYWIDSALWEVDNVRICDATKLFEEGHKMGFKLNSVSFNIMIKMWLKNDNWEKARKVFDEMLEREVEPTVVTYNSQIGFLCRRGDMDESRRLFDDMRTKGKRGNAVTYALLMEGLCASGNFKEAKKMMFDMEYHGCKVELVNYGVLMTDLAKRGLIEEAKGLLAEMKKRRIKPDVVMFNILIDYFCNEGAASEAYKILVDMQVKGCEPNAATYRMVVDGFCKIEDFMGALKVLNAMLYSKHSPRIETFQSLGIGLVRSGNVEDLCFVLEEMNKRKMSLDSKSWEILVKESCMDDKFGTRSLDDVLCSG